MDTDACGRAYLSAGPLAGVRDRGAGPRLASRRRWWRGRKRTERRPGRDRRQDATPPSRYFPRCNATQHANVSAASRDGLFPLSSHPGRGLSLPTHLLPTPPGYQDLPTYDIMRCSARLGEVCPSPSASGRDGRGAMTTAVGTGPLGSLSSGLGGVCCPRTGRPTRFPFGSRFLVYEGAIEGQESQARRTMFNLNTGPLLIGLGLHLAKGPERTKPSQPSGEARKGRGPALCRQSGRVGRRK